MQSLGVEVTPMSYELHPEVPTGGHPIRPGGRLDRVLDHVAAECEAVDLPMVKPRRSPNTRRALELAELLRRHEPSAFVAFDDACYRAHWVEGRDLGDPDELRSLVRAAGADADSADERLARGEGAAALTASMAMARELGVTATPAWWVDERLLIPGAQPRATVQRWITKLAERTVDRRDRPGEATGSVT
jgi:predicted DsbA family dithiol-disulfide isomerase